MAEHVRAKLLGTLCGVLGLCFAVGLGCQAQAAYSNWTGNKSSTASSRAGRASEKGIDRALEAMVPNEFLKGSSSAAEKHGETGTSPVLVKRSYQGIQLVDNTSQTASGPQAGVLPEIRAADEAFAKDASATQPVPVAAKSPAGDVRVITSGQPELPAVTTGQPSSVAQRTELPEIKQADGPRLPELPELHSGTGPSSSNVIKVSSDTAASQPELPPAPAQPPQPLPKPAPVSLKAPDGPPAVLPAPRAPAQPAPAGPCCAAGQGSAPGEPMREVPPPHELQKVSHPPYMVEPPDILLLDAIRIVPRPPYVVQPLDVLLIHVTETLPNQPIEGAFVVAPDGTVSLGFTYGVVQVAGKSLEAVQDALRQQLARVLRNPQISVGLGQFRGLQQLRGEHLVRQDGTISLGTYGSVYVTGLTIPQIKFAVERHLSRFLLEPEISVDVFAYNSKVYYIIADGAGFGQQVFRFPITGNETVLDAIANIQGLPVVASKRHLWLARPAPACHACVQVLPIDWMAITQGGSTVTNYQLFPGDRIYIKSNCLIHLDNVIAMIVSPIERLFGVTLLGTTTVQSIRNFNGTNNNNNGAAFIVP